MSIEMLKDNSAITSVENHASRCVIWHLSLGSTWHKLVASLWVLSAAIHMRHSFPAQCAPCVHTSHTSQCVHFRALEHPIVPAIQKHPSTVHQAVKDHAHGCIQSLRGVSMTDSEGLWPQLVRCALNFE